MAMGRVPLYRKAPLCTKTMVQAPYLGYTLVELVTVILILAILSVTFFPKLNDRSFDERGLYDATRAALQHAHRLAVSSRRYVCVTITASSGILALTQDSALPDGKTTVTCGTAIQIPSPNKNCSATNQVCAPKGVSYSANSSLIFSPKGQLVSSPGVLAATASISISNQPAISITPETGLVQ